MYIVLYRKPKGSPENCVTGTEQIKIREEDEQVLVNYHFFRVSPFCKDGYKYEMDIYLNQLGWDTGMMGITYKEGIKPEEILYCLAYKEAYEKVYHLKVPHPLGDIPLKIKEFLDFIDRETLKIKQRYVISQPKLSSLQDITKFLKQEGFVYLESG